MEEEIAEEERLAQEAEVGQFNSPCAKFLS
jgi:hypothetical protein